MLGAGKKFRNTGQREKMPRQDSSNNSNGNKSDPKGASYTPIHHIKMKLLDAEPNHHPPQLPPEQRALRDHTWLLPEPRGRLTLAFKKSAGLPHPQVPVA